MIERCICSTIHSNRDTYPGGSCIVDVGGLPNSTMWQKAEQKFAIDAVHLLCPKINTGN